MNRAPQTLILMTSILTTYLLESPIKLSPPTQMETTSSSAKILHHRFSMFENRPISILWFSTKRLVTTLSEYCSSGFPKVLMSKLSYSNYEFVCRIRKHILRAGDTSHHTVMCGNGEARCTLGEE